MKNWNILVMVMLFCIGSDTFKTVDTYTSQNEAPNDDPNIVNILFIGNSLTFFNNEVDCHLQ